MIQSETTSTGFIFSPLRVWLGGGGGWCWILSHVSYGMLGHQSLHLSDGEQGSHLPLHPVLSPSPTGEEPSSIKALASQAQPWGVWGPPPLPSFSGGAGQMLRQHRRPWATSSRAELGSSGSPSYGPSPRPQLPSFLSARHLVLVPSKRMRLGSLPLPVIKASPAQQTPKRAPPPDAAASRRPPWPPHHPGRRPGLGRSAGSPGSENPGLP